MSSVDESGLNAASGAAEPVKPQAEATDGNAPEIAVEPFDHARHRKLESHEAPILFVPATRQRFGRAAVLAVAIALSAAAGSAVGAMAAVAFAKPQPVSLGRCAHHRSECDARRDHEAVERSCVAEGEHRQQHQNRERADGEDRRSRRPCREGASRTGLACRQAVRIAGAARQAHRVGCAAPAAPALAAGTRDTRARSHRSSTTVRPW